LGPPWAVRASGQKMNLNPNWVALVNSRLPFLRKIGTPSHENCRRDLSRWPGSVKGCALGNRGSTGRTDVVKNLNPPTRAGEMKNFGEAALSALPLRPSILVSAWYLQLENQLQAKLNLPRATFANYGVVGIRCPLGYAKRTRGVGVAGRSGELRDVDDVEGFRSELSR
jgi:hypothetical protein